MLSNQISAFEYVSILVSIIWGLGITQLLSSFSDLLYQYKETTVYWPHTLWILFILFLHVQDWFITYQLKDKTACALSEVLFILLYPITQFFTVKVLLPANETDKSLAELIEAAAVLSFVCNFRTFAIKRTITINIF